jgi:hypothetical protein
MALIYTMRTGGDWFVLLMLGTFALWPLMILLAFTVSWFGLLAK